MFLFVKTVDYCLASEGPIPEGVEVGELLGHSQAGLLGGGGLTHIAHRARVLAFFSILLKITERSLRSFPFF